MASEPEERARSLRTDCPHRSMWPAGQPIAAVECDLCLAAALRAYGEQCRREALETVPRLTQLEHAALLSHETGQRVHVGCGGEVAHGRCHGCDAVGDPAGVVHPLDAEDILAEYAARVHRAIAEET